MNGKYSMNTRRLGKFDAADIPAYIVAEEHFAPKES